jgi:hypothetical protein
VKVQHKPKESVSTQLCTHKIYFWNALQIILNFAFLVSASFALTTTMDIVKIDYMSLGMDIAIQFFQNYLAG